MDFVAHVLRAFVPLFVAISILGILPLYMSLTEDLAPTQRISVDRQSLLAALLLTAFGVRSVRLGLTAMAAAASAP